MAQANLFILENCNLFCGDADPTDSKHLTLESITFPDLQGIFADHHPGGSMVAMEFHVGVQKMMVPFKLKGWDPVLLASFGLGTRKKDIYTALGVLRDKRTGRAFEAKGIVEAMLGKASAESFQRGASMGFDYALNEITHYELYVDGQEILFWDFWTNEWRSQGVNQNADANRIMQIPGASAT